MSAEDALAEQPLGEQASGEGMPGDRAEQSDRNGVQSVARAFRLLELLAEAQGELPLGELAAAVGLPTTTAHRLLRTMAAEGYVRQLPSRRYGLGLRLIRLGQRVDTQLSPIARPYLAELVAKTGETANLALLDDNQVLYVAQVPSPHAMRMFTEVGHRTFAHSTGVGKAMLSTLDPSAVEGIVAKTGLPRATETTIVELPTLNADLALTRERGYAVDDGEHELGVRCYAVPLQGLPVTAAISVSGPSVRLNDGAAETTIRLLQRAAAELSAELAGGSDRVR